MKHVDPASTAFLALSSREQAQVYASMGWTLDNIADELGVTEELAAQWLDQTQAKPTPKNPCQKISDDIIAEIKRRRRAGQTVIEVSETLGVAPKTVNRHSKGLKTQTWSKIDPVKAMKMKAAGFPITEIARHFKAGRSGVQAAIRKLERSSPNGKASA